VPPLRRGDAIRCDVAVIGGGLAGLVAATTAACEGLKVIVIRRGLGTTAMSSGGLDWGEGAAAVLTVAGTRQAEPGPELPEIGASEAFTAFRDWLAGSGARLAGEPAIEMPLMDIFGNIRHTNLTFDRFAAGRLDRWPGPESGGKVLFLGIEGYSPYRPEWVVRVAVSAGLLRDGQAAAGRVPIPGHGGATGLPAARVARLLDDPETAGRLAALVAAAATGAGAELVALPPVLGLEEAETVYRTIASAAGKTRVFELLSPLPSVPGRRLLGLLDRVAGASGVEIVPGRVTGAVSSAPRVNTPEDDRVPRLSSLTAVSGGREWPVEASEFILATGKFAAGGLTAVGQVLSETVFGLPVFAPPPPGWPPGMVPAATRPVREMVWTRLRARHPVFEAGLSVDTSLRPLTAGGRPAFANLRAAGSVVGGYNPLTDGVGSGEAVVSGFRAGRLAARSVRVAPAGPGAPPHPSLKEGAGR